MRRQMVTTMYNNHTRAWLQLRMSRPLFVRRSRGGLCANEKEEKTASNDNQYNNSVIYLIVFTDLCR